jgi:nucleotide-binding universal stress UspA family protein
VSYKSILVNIDIDGLATPLIKLATEIARRFDAKLIGCSGADIVPPFTGSDGTIVYAELIEQQRTEIEARLVAAQQEFVTTAGSEIDLEWRGDAANPTRLLTTLARTADLIITGSPEGASAGNPYRSIDLGDLLLHCGRPVLVAASGAEHLSLSKALVAWKDSREARRAVLDAIPLLSLASDVHLVTVDDDAGDHTWKGLSDVSAFLARHNIKANAEVLPAKEHAEKICAFAQAWGADLIVSGAYGHSRVREWVFGGVTRTLLDEIGVNRFMSS